MLSKNKLFFSIFLKKEQGFTVIELFLVITLTLVLVSLSVPIYSSLQISNQLNGSTSLLVQTLRTGKERSMARVNNSIHGIKLQENSYVLYQGSSYATRTQEYDRVTELEGISLSWSLSGSGQTDEIIFSKSLGVPNMIGTITLTNEDNKTKTISINEIGKIEQ